MAKVVRQSSKTRAVKKKGVKGVPRKGVLPCSPSAVMMPTEKVKQSKCPGVNNRMKKCRGKKVSEVLWKMEYAHPKKSPDRLLRYSLLDLRYDLLRGYLKLSSTASSPAKAKVPTVAKVPKVTKAKAAKASKLKGDLPCPGTWLMIPTGKKAKCEGIRNRMRKCQGHPKVEEVVGRMSYKHPAKCPDGLITYSLMDLNYDILRQYVTLRAAPGRRSEASAPSAAKATRTSSETSSEHRGIMVPTGKVAKCSGINARMDKVKGLQVEQAIGKVKYKGPKGFVTYSTKDLVHDLLGGYLRLQKARGAARGAAAQKSGKKTQVVKDALPKVARPRGKRGGLSVLKLRKRLKALGLKVVGTKAELEARYQAGQVADAIDVEAPQNMPEEVAPPRTPEPARNPPPEWPYS